MLMEVGVDLFEQLGISLQRAFIDHDQHAMRTAARSTKRVDQDRVLRGEHTAGEVHRILIGNREFL
jgi:hypothetical protein